MSTAGPYVIAVDLGTSGPKAAVLSLDGRVVASSRAGVETTFLPDQGAEQDPEAVWTAVKQACGTALSASTVDRTKVLAVICSSQYSSIVPVDAAGRPTMNMVLWMDKRGAVDRLRDLAGFPSGVDRPWQMLRWMQIHGLGHAGP